MDTGILDSGFQLELATESIVVRAIVGSLVAVLLSRLVVRHVSLRSSMVRALSAIVPTVALVAVLLAFWSSSPMPTLLRPTSLNDGRILDGASLQWLSSASMAVLGVSWFAVAATRVALRVVRMRRCHQSLLVDAVAPPAPLARLVDRLAAAHRVRVPDVRISADCPGGAALVGVRRPTLVLDASLLASLDPDELRGVVAHELAHLRRHDNAVTLALGVVRDCVFFVPGGRWALQQLHTERELAADETAVAVTRSPAALASGLLKVLEQRAAAPSTAPGSTAMVGVANLMTEGTLVRRVHALVDDAPAPSRARLGGEVGVVVAATGLSVLAAFVLPGLAVSRTDVQGVLFEFRPAVDGLQERALTGEAAAFDAYRRASVSVPAIPFATPELADDRLGAVDVAGATTRLSDLLADRGPSAVALAVTAQDLPDEAACFDVRRACDATTRSPGLGLQPLVDPPVSALRLPPEDRLVARSVVRVGERVSVSLLENFRLG